MLHTKPIAFDPPTSWTRVCFNRVSSRLLAIALALLAASAVSAHAQSTWTGANSSDWFLAENWIGGRPTQSREGIINTAPPAVIATPGAEARNLQVGSTATGALSIQNTGTLKHVASDVIQDSP